MFHEQRVNEWLGKGQQMLTNEMGGGLMVFWWKRSESILGLKLSQFMIEAHEESLNLN
jgi:hypothetical protein